MVTQTDIGARRGWLDTAAARSIARIDRQLRRPLQITEAGRTWARQKEHWDTYQRNGRPIALHPDTPSIHQLGNAIDTDERPSLRAVLEDHGWKQTVYRNGRLVEPWHFEYSTTRDNHLHDPEPSAPAPSPVPEEDDMKLITWNGRAWVVSDEKVAYVRNDRESLQMAKMLTKQSEAVDISNDQLTELLLILALPWAALDATFRGQAFDNQSNWGEGTVWSRQIAEGHEDALRDESLARSLDELLESVSP